MLSLKLSWDVGGDNGETAIHRVSFLFFIEYLKKKEVIPRWMPSSLHICGARRPLHGWATVAIHSLIKQNLLIIFLRNGLIALVVIAVLKPNPSEAICNKATSCEIFSFNFAFPSPIQNRAMNSATEQEMMRRRVTNVASLPPSLTWKCDTGVATRDTLSRKWQGAWNTCGTLLRVVIRRVFS